MDDDLPLPPGAFLEGDDGKPLPLPSPATPTRAPAGGGDGWRSPWVFVVGGVLAVLVLLAVVLAANGGGSDSTTPATSTGPKPAPTTSTTQRRSTSTTLSDAQLYQQLQAEIERACSTAMETGKVPDVVFQDRWSVVSNPEKLMSSINRCIDGRTQAQIDAAKPVDVDQVVKDPDAVTNEVVVMVVRVTSYDSATGPCTFRAQWDAEGHAIASIYRGTDAVFTAGSPDVGCPVLQSLDQRDVARVWARVQGSTAIDTNAGAATVPAFHVLKVEVLQKG